MAAAGKGARRVLFAAAGDGAAALAALVAPGPIALSLCGGVFGADAAVTASSSPTRALARTAEARGEREAAERASKLEVVVLSRSQLDSLAALQLCRGLIKLDLSHCGLSSFPSRFVWACLPQLELLLCHSNNFSSLAQLVELRFAAKLLGLTLADNPVARLGAYRHTVVNCAPNLLLLDDRLVSDDEVVEGACFSNSSTLYGSASTFFFPVLISDSAAARKGSESEELALLESQRRFLRAAHAAASPVIRIQRWYRRQHAEKRARTEPKADREAASNAALGNKGGGPLPPRLGHPAPPAPPPAPLPGPSTSSAPAGSQPLAPSFGSRTSNAALTELLVGDVGEFAMRLCLQIAQSACATRSATFIATLTRSRFTALVEGSSTGRATLIAERSSERPAAPWRPSWLRGTAPSQLRRRGCKVPRSVVRAAELAALAPVGSSGVGSKRRRHVPLLSLRLPSEREVETFTTSLQSREMQDLLASHGVDRLLVMRAAEAARETAALRIQSVFRSSRTRKAAAFALTQLVLQRRAATCVQRWWRERLWRRRMHFLGGLVRYAQSIGSQELFVRTDVFDLLQAAPNRWVAAQLVPELRVRFCFAHDGSGDDGESCCSVPDLAASTRLVFSHQPLPSWLLRAVGLPPAKVAEPCPEMDRALPERLRELLERGVDSKLLAISSAASSARANASLAASTDADAAAALGKRKSLHRGSNALREKPYVRLIFPSVQEAVLRAMVLVTMTWDPWMQRGALYSSTCIPLLTAKHIQSFDCVNNPVLERARLLQLYWTASLARSSSDDPPLLHRHAQTIVVSSRVPRLRAMWGEGGGGGRRTAPEPHEHRVASGSALSPHGVGAGRPGDDERKMQHRQDQQQAPPRPLPPPPCPASDGLVLDGGPTPRARISDSSPHTSRLRAREARAEVKRLARQAFAQREAEARLAHERARQLQQLHTERMARNTEERVASLRHARETVRCKSARGGRSDAERARDAADAMRRAKTQAAAARRIERTQHASTVRQTSQLERAITERALAERTRLEHEQREHARALVEAQRARMEHLRQLHSVATAFWQQRNLIASQFQKGASQRQRDEEQVVKKARVAALALAQRQAAEKMRQEKLSEMERRRHAKTEEKLLSGRSLARAEEARATERLVNRLKARADLPAPSLLPPPARGAEEPSDADEKEEAPISEQEAEALKVDESAMNDLLEGREDEALAVQVLAIKSLAKRTRQELERLIFSRRQGGDANGSSP